MRRLLWLEVMRGLAAGWVLFYHVHKTMQVFVSPDAGYGPWAENGHLGVEFFFVLSGFIIAYSVDRILESGGGFREYAKARLIRIYVPYLPIGIGMCALMAIFPRMSAADHGVGLFTSLTLLPSSLPPALGVAYTLVHEMLFYSLFALYFLSPRSFWVGFATWIAVIAYFYCDCTRALPAETFLSPLNLCFALGVFAHRFCRNGMPDWLAISLAASGGALVVFEAALAEPAFAVMSMGFAFCTAAASSHWAQRRQPWKPLLVLGAASYSLYLVHTPILSALIRVLLRYAPALPHHGMAIVLGVCGLASGLAYYFGYERFALALVRRRFAPKASSGPGVRSGTGASGDASAVRPDDDANQTERVKA